MTTEDVVFLMRFLTVGLTVGFVVKGLGLVASIISGRG